MNRASEIEQTAAEWIARQEGGDWSAEDSDALRSWLDEGMAHKAAFWRLRHGWAAADRIGALGFQPAKPRSRRARPWRHWVKNRPAIASAVAASLALVVGIGAVTLRTRPSDAPAPKPMLVQTPVGGQRTIALHDGSRVQLNTATVVRTAKDADTREVWLDKGEAYFDIAHRPDHPFIVHAGPRTVTVLGTRFTVRRDGEKVTVAVLSGRVRVEDAIDGASSRAAVIGKGDIAYAQSHGTLVALAAPDQVNAMTGWRDGVLIFNNRRLADAVADFNRYSTLPIRIDDPAVANIRIGGTFQIDNSTGFLHLLQSAYGLEVRQRENEILVDP
ncbi:FecR family protein [Sphingomonas fuzhouensis]|uniref:FecR family protein n=1 Tax=Sphingomonas fuzhouensis TaxID=3106033 RepID=UPI002AFF9692|nr:FecR domain-containing protein [Sphingomonas sp. SGZ-02]